MSDEYTIDVYLYPPPGAGVQAVNTPNGPMAVPMPFNEYKNVSDVITGPFCFKEPVVEEFNATISFRKRDGTRITSNAVYVIVQTPKPAAEA